MFEKLKSILVEDLNVNEHDITLDAELISDLGLNSLELADLAMLCEERFEVEFEEEELKKLLSIRDIVNYLELNAKD
jgi:acyl carrier protein